MKVLVINAGSSSIKYQLYEMPEAEVLAKGVVERIGDQDARLIHSCNEKDHSKNIAIPDHEKGMELILSTLTDEQIGVIDDIAQINAVGHRVVHGGEEFTGSVLIDKKVIASINKYADLAPLHNPPNLTGIDASMKNLPGAKQVACFDTAFHASIPKVAYIYALPYQLYQKYGIRRYGFHGTSHRYVSEIAAEMMGKNTADINIITAHLGNGGSLTAVKAGKSIDTSMGLTPLEGIAMGTRCGDIDPAILFYLAEKGYKTQDLNDMCNKKSGLLGISNKSNDMRNLTQLAEQGDELSKLAIDVFAYRIRKYIGTYTAVLGTLDALVFTGGIGENSFIVRQKVCKDMNQIGIDIDQATNAKIRAEQADISKKDSRVKVFVIPTDEELIIARDTYSLAKQEK